MSNHNAGEIPAHRKPKGSLTMVISQGLGGPKAQPRGVADGQQVNIPVLPFFAERATKFSPPGGLLDSRWQFDTVPQGAEQGCRNVSRKGGKSGQANFPEKPL